ncbi:hypothetical protein [Flavobacterium reichenbachii]|uniref:Uncharacterized protein n=1 Tax=Flavobacterium reichenbachii TaxID=362418 RepID=A0A085ZM66_9FLAO|nr:hypothetical protein [Flavobacterium reichenbachii]KFF05530.1 hypothetical protein IW19_08365 [Flavobacterium reichenbachii]OXB17866.1 hypothetical protein B0A68_02695 [Flavobacterium reichenbachii]
MKPFLKLSMLTLIVTQTSVDQKINDALISKGSEINFAKTQKRGIKKNNIIYYVENDLQTISAYKRSKLKWQTNVISVCGKPKVGEPEIRYIGYNTNKLLIVMGKHNFAEIDINSGITTLVG